MKIDLTNFDLENAQDPIAMEEGEYKVMIIECDDPKENSAGNPYILPRMEIVGEPLAKDFTNYFGLPTTDMEPKELQRAAARLKNFCQCFNLDFEGFDTSELAGSEGWVILGKKYDDQYGDQNFIKKFITGA